MVFQGMLMYWTLILCVYKYALWIVQLWHRSCSSVSLTCCSKFFKWSSSKYFTCAQTYLSTGFSKKGLFLTSEYTFCSCSRINSVPL